MIVMPLEKDGNWQDLILTLTEYPMSDVEVRLADKADDTPILASLCHVRPCYPEMSDVSWSGHTKNRR